MNRIEFEDHVCDVRKELAFYEKVDKGCAGCSQFIGGNCKKHGQVPADFVPTGCDEWEFDNVPF